MIMLKFCVRLFNVKCIILKKTLKTKHTIEGLTSGSRCWLRVLAVGTAGRGAPSGVETKIVP